MNSMPIWHTRRGAGVSAPYAAGEEPLRAELLNAEQMEERGREIAAQHKARTSRLTANPLLQRLSQNASVIRECCKVLADAINRMPDRERLVLTLYYYEGMTLAEIGNVLGVTESRVCQIHTKAIFQLRSRLTEPMPERGLVT